MDVAIDPSAAAPAGPIEAAVMAACAGGAATFTIASGASTLAAPSALESVAFPGQCLGSTGATLYPGALDVGLQPCAAAPQWQYNASGNEELVNTLANLCLDVLQANASAGERVDAYACKGAHPDEPNQRFAALYGAGHTVTLQSLLAPAPAPSLCVGLEALPSPLGEPYVAISMRIPVYVRNGPPPSGYTLRVGLSPNATAGAPWQLNYAGATLASGTTPQPVVAGVFYPATVAAKGQQVTITWAGATLTTVTDSKSSYGMIAMGSGWHEAWFDNVRIF